MSITTRPIPGLLFLGVLAIARIGGGDPTVIAQVRQEPGRSIGTITTAGDLIVMTLDEGVLGRPNLFDLAGRTLRFTPGANGYRAENLPLAWDKEFGKELSGASVKLERFAFPFSGQRWTELSVGVTGSISCRTRPRPSSTVSRRSASS